MIDQTFVKAIQEKLEKYGILIIDNIDINEQTFVDLTNMLGEAINLPNFLVPAKIKGHPEIARVANFGSEDGIVNPNYAFGFYWHHDG